MKPKVLIAGAHGMVGKALVSELKLKKNIKLLTPTKKELNYLNFKEVDKYFKKRRPNFVYIVAAKVGGILANKKNKIEFFENNQLIQMNLFKCINKYKVKKSIFLGSSCIYPKNSKQPIKEKYLLSNQLEKTNEAYALAKIVGLKVCEFYNQQYKTNFFTLMPCNLYGPYDNFHLKNSHFIPALIKKFIEAKRRNKNSVEIWGSGLPRREVMHVDDLANAIGYLLKLKINMIENF